MANLKSKQCGIWDHHRCKSVNSQPVVFQIGKWSHSSIVKYTLGDRGSIWPQASTESKFILNLFCMFLDYKEYLKSDHWKKTRVRIIEQRVCCEICESDENLNVHHMHYLTLWSESDDCLLLLCWKCHTELHEQFDKSNMKTLLKFSKYFLEQKKNKAEKQSSRMIKKAVKRQEASLRKTLNRATIFQLKPDRAIYVMNVIEKIHNEWDCTLQNAATFWVTFEEWVKCQHFFLSPASAPKRAAIMDALYNLSMQT